MTTFRNYVIVTGPAMLVLATIGIVFVYLLLEVVLP